MKLYMRPVACSLSPHIVCRELDIAVELIEVYREGLRTAAGYDFLEVNGNGYVPALQLDDGEVLIEGPAIVQYLADLKPNSGLLPAPGTMARVRAQSWLNFITSELHKPLAMGFSADYAAVKEPLRLGVEKRLNWLSQHFAGPWLMGEAFTVADAYLFVCLNWSPFQAIDLTRWPVLVELMRRVAARPRVQQALTAEGLVRHGPGDLFFATPKYVQALAAASVS